MADLNDVMLMLGELKGGMAGLARKVDGLQEDFDQETRDAAQSRRVLYQRVEAVERSVIDGNRTAETMREELTEKVEALGEELAQHKGQVIPAVEDWRRIRNLGLGITGVIAAGGLSVGAMVTWAGEASATAIRSWLGIH